MSKEKDIVKEVKEMDRDDFIEFVKSIQEEPKEEGVAMFKLKTYPKIGEN